MSEDTSNWQPLGDVVARITELVQPTVWFTHDDELMCPACHGTNLHHNRVIVFSRVEDEAQILRTEVYSGRGAVLVKRDEGIDNPSNRRDGIAIGFYCEDCPATPELTIKQHKGVTFIQWRGR